MLRTTRARDATSKDPVKWDYTENVKTMHSNFRKSTSRGFTVREARYVSTRSGEQRVMHAIYATKPNSQANYISGFSYNTFKFVGWVPTFVAFALLSLATEIRVCAEIEGARDETGMVCETVAEMYYAFRLIERILLDIPMSNRNPARPSMFEFKSTALCHWFSRSARQMAHDDRSRREWMQKFSHENEMWTELLDCLRMFIVVLPKV